MNSVILILGLFVLVATLANSEAKGLKELEQSLKNSGKIAYAVSLDSPSGPESRSLEKKLQGDELVVKILEEAIEYAYNLEGHPGIPIERSLGRKLKLRLQEIDILNAVEANPGNDYEFEGPETQIIANPLLLRGHNIKDINRENGNKLREFVDAAHGDITVEDHKDLFRQVKALALKYTKGLNSRIQLVPLVAFRKRDLTLPKYDLSKPQVGFARIDLSGREDPGLVVVDLEPVHAGPF
ncbi:hypothetical protein DdX_14170 [Ditylenchus destructor]|uniref:Uncharacterized protein n=1 Tax=Ditylenchus destructor TaxID=166010 RepID=A0AAD4MRJ0_9BILA|nr:hypothetical protein DdX_14170 [Ditylenchus destructor]